MSIFLLLHNVGMMLGTNKANRARDEAMSVLNELHKTWDEEMNYELELSRCGRNHYILCISCIDDILDIIWLSLDTSRWKEDI